MQPKNHALPWKELPLCEHYDEDEEYIGDSVLEEEFILHACNAYPKLVEFAKLVKDTYLDGISYDAFELLKELGEL